MRAEVARSDWLTELRAGEQGFDSWQGQGVFSIRHRGQIGFAAHRMETDTGGMVNLPERVADHFPPTRTEIKNAWTLPHPPPHASSWRGV
jgi:hypothetical protein